MHGRGMGAALAVERICRADKGGWVGSRGVMAFCRTCDVLRTSIKMSVTLRKSCNCAITEGGYSGEDATASKCNLE